MIVISSPVDAVPAAGVKAYERQQVSQEMKNRLTAMVETLKASLTVDVSIRVPVAEVLESFQWMGLPDLTDIALGDVLHLQSVKRVQASRKRNWHVPGLNRWAMVDRLLVARLERRGMECPLLTTQRESLLRSKLMVYP